MKSLCTTLASLLLFVLAVRHASAAALERPNIVIILADDLGYADLGFTGCKDVATPYIDSLAANGIRFTQAYVSAPICSPSRAGLMTGRYQQRSGHDDNDTPELSLKEVTLGNRMKACGYFTGMIGKWHLGDDPERLPPARGFDETFHPDGNAAYFGARILDSIKSNKFEPAKDKKLYTTELNSARAADFIRRHKGEPFCLYLAFNNVHLPLEVPQKYIDRITCACSSPDRRKMAAMVLALDDAVGVVLQALKKAGLEENTLIFFLSDNGGVMRFAQGREGISFNTPFTGGKYTVREGGIRTPLVLQWKARFPKARTYDRPVISLDLLPTVISAAAGTINPDWQLDGVNLLPFLDGKVAGDPHAALYWRVKGRIAIRLGDWKLSRASTSSSKELYNLASDIAEGTNLAIRRPDKVAELEAAWKQWNAQMSPPQQPAKTAKGKAGED